MLHLNQSAATLCQAALQNASQLQIASQEIGGARVLDFGVEVPGGIQAGLWLARICLSDLASVSLVPSKPAGSGINGHVPVQVQVQTDHPLWACLGSQYAGWPVQADDFFAMGSGPMRLLRGREPMLESLDLRESPSSSAGPFSAAVGVLESDRLPSPEAVATVAEECGVKPNELTLCVAPVTSLAGVVQVVARSVETAMHKLHDVGLEPNQVQSGYGIAPLPPPATDMVGGIGRTNDAILYGGHVQLWMDADQAQLDELVCRIPSTSSDDYGKPFKQIFKSYEYDFYKVDPGLFSPGQVTVTNLRTGETQTHGRLNAEVLAASFGLARETESPCES